MKSTYFSIFMFSNTVEPLFRGALIGLKSAPFFFNEGKEYKGLSSFFVVVVDCRRNERFVSSRRSVSRLVQKRSHSTMKASHSED